MKQEAVSLRSDMAYKVQLVSDLHSEFWKTRDFAVVDRIVPANAKDVVLVVAGDLDNNLSRIEQWMSDVFSRYRHTVYVCGKHEFYGNRLDKMLSDIKSLASKHRNISVLEDESVELDGTVFIGSTLWTDNRNGAQFASNFTDYMYIQDENFIPIRWQQIYAMHEQSKQSIKKLVAKSKGKKVVVVSHHMPKNALVHKWFADSPLNPFFASDVDTDGVDLWLYGHTHIGNDVTIEKTRCVCNPHGYIMSNEPVGFKHQLMLEP